MMNIYQMRNSFSLKEHNTAITREDFEGSFTRTRESVRFTFNGWDGKSYDGESPRRKGLPHQPSRIREHTICEGRKSPLLHR